MWLLSAFFVVLQALSAAQLLAAEYVADMSCHEVAGFAETTAQQKAAGVTLKEAVSGLRQSLGSEYQSTKMALERIIRSIYTRKELAAANPDQVAEAYRR